MSDKKAKCIYSAITGDYDFVRELKHKSPEFDYILFTNNKKVKSKTWDVRHIDNEDELSNVKLARQIKLEYYKYVPEYEFSIWVDGNIQISGDILRFLNTLPLDVSDFFIGSHPHRQNIMQEAQTCVQLKKDSHENLSKQIEAYKAEKMPFAHIPLVESGVLVRRDTKKVKKFCKAWFKQILKFTPRDQIAFSYTLWKNPMAVFLFPAFRDHYKNVFTLGIKHEKLK